MSYRGGRGGFQPNRGASHGRGGNRPHPYQDQNRDQGRVEDYRNQQNEAFNQYREQARANVPDTEDKTKKKNKRRNNKKKEALTADSVKKQGIKEDLNTKLDGIEKDFAEIDSATAGFIDTVSPDIRGMSIRTGGANGFTNIYAKMVKNEKSVPMMYVGSAAILQFLARDKSIMALNNMQKTANGVEIGETKVHLTPFQYQTLKMIGRHDWRQIRLAVDEIDHADIVRSCVRIGGIVPTDAQIIDMRNDVFNERCTVHLGRYLTCRSDPFVLCVLAFMHRYKESIPEQIATAYIAGRMAQVLVGDGCIQANILIDYEDSVLSAQVCSSGVDDGNLRNLILAMDLNIRYLTNTAANRQAAFQASDDVPLVVITNAAQLCHISSMLTSAYDNTQQMGFKTYTYGEICKPIEYPFLMNQENMGIVPLFESLENAFMVNRYQGAQQEIRGRYGPIDRPIAPRAMHVTLLTDMLIQQHVQLLVGLFCLGTDYEGSTFMCRRHAMISSLYTQQGA